MRENRTSGSEGGVESILHSYPYQPLEQRSDNWKNSPSFQLHPRALLLPSFWK